MFDAIRYLIYKRRYGRTGSVVKYTAHVRSGSVLEGQNIISRGSTFRGFLGYASYLGPCCDLCATVGRYSSIAPYVKSNPGIHTYRYPFVSTSPFFFKKGFKGGDEFATYDTIKNLRFADPERRTDVLIGNDCWIGEDAFLAGGVRVGDGAVVLAKAAVVKDVPPYAIVGGVPARVVGYRYDKENVAFLLGLKWWDFPVEWLRAHWELFSNLDRLKAYCAENPEEIARLSENS